MKYDRVFVVAIDSLSRTKEAKGAENEVNSNILNSINDISNIMNAKYGKCAIPNLKKLGIENLYNLSHENNNITNMLGEKMENTFTNNKLSIGLIKELERKFEKKIVGNKSSNASTILNQLAYRENSYDEIIVYTTNSTINICGNEDKMGLSQLYKYCELAMETVLNEGFNIDKIVARPYKINQKLECTFTQNKREYQINNKSVSYLEGLKMYGYDIIAIGNIEQIFQKQGINNTPLTNSTDGMEKTIEIASSNFKGLCFTNLAGLNEIHGNENDLSTLENFDVKIGTLITLLNHNDLLIITTNTSEHEPVPVISYSKEAKIDYNCNICKYENIATTIAKNFKIDKISNHLINSKVV